MVHEVEGFRHRLRKNCVFIDEAGFNINMRSNWARSTIGTPAFVELDKARAPPSHTIIGAIHSSSVIYVAMKKPPLRKEKAPKPVASKSERSKKRKLVKGKQRAGEIIIEEPVVEYVEVKNIDDNWVF
jgi:hypothetical protein